MSQDEASVKDNLEHIDHHTPSDTFTQNQTNSNNVDDEAGRVGAAEEMVDGHQNHDGGSRAGSSNEVMSSGSQQDLDRDNKLSTIDVRRSNRAVRSTKKASEGLTDAEGESDDEVKSTYEDAEWPELVTNERKVPKLKVHTKKNLMALNLKSKISTMAAFPSAGELTDWIARFYRFKELRIPSINTNLASASSHQLMAELYAGAQRSQFTLTRRTGGNDTITTLVCNRADAYYWKRDKQICPYFLSVAKVGYHYTITHSDLRHNHKLNGSKSPDSIRPITAGVISIVGTLGFQPSIPGSRSRAKTKVIDPLEKDLGGSTGASKRKAGPLDDKDDNQFGAKYDSLGMKRVQFLNGRTAVIRDRMKQLNNSGVLILPSVANKWSAPTHEDYRLQHSAACLQRGVSSSVSKSTGSNFTLICSFYSAIPRCQYQMTVSKKVIRGQQRWIATSERAHNDHIIWDTPVVGNIIVADRDEMRIGAVDSKGKMKELKVAVGATESIDEADDVGVGDDSDNQTEEKDSDDATLDITASIKAGPSPPLPLFTSTPMTSYPKIDINHLPKIETDHLPEMDIDHLPPTLEEPREDVIPISTWKSSLKPNNSASVFRSKSEIKFMQLD